MKKPVIVFLHLGYWFLYTFLHVLIYGIMSEKLASGPRPLHWSVFMLEFAFIPGLIAFYTFYTLLFSKFFSKRKILLLVVSGLIVSLLTVIPSELLMLFTLPGIRSKWTYDIYLGMGVLVTINALLNGILGLVMRGFITGYADIKIKETLNKKNYEMELELLKSQINPHFLFNTLNNIDTLILKDPPKASLYLNQLSDIMRFMLYETKTQKIPMARELDYVEKYLALQKIRTANLNYVNYSVDGDHSNILLEPMLFIPFIENAFKHSEDKKIDHAIEISFSIQNRRVVFCCRNNYSKNGQAKLDHSGIGNELISKRLSLLYPEQHKLEIADRDNNYKVTLEINL